MTAKQRDARAKSKMKAYADRNIQARQSNIQVGDRVLVRAETRNKLSPAYILREYTVTHKRGNMVTAESHGHMVTPEQLQVQALVGKTDSGRNTGFRRRAV